MLIAKYLISNTLHKIERNGRPYYKMDFPSCSSGGYANSDEEAIEIFARWCNVPKEYITVVANA
jgi:hypothetical protein